MPLIEDAEYERLKNELAAAKGAENSKKLLDVLGAHPKHRSALLQMIKDIAPNAAIPEIDAAKPVLEKLDALGKEFSDYKKSQEERDAEREKRAREATAESGIAAGRKWLREEGFTAEGIEKIEKLIEGEGLVAKDDLSTYKLARDVFDKRNPPETPIMPGNYGRAMPLIDETANDDLKAAVSLPRGQRQDQALKRWTAKQIQDGMADIVRARRGGF